MTVSAQVVPDTTLGPENSALDTVVLPDGSERKIIEGGARRGASLFHSFELFGIGEEQQVYFANPSGIEKILSRVTGNAESQINGTLGVLGPADLFLLNPNGIVFGANAQLDLRGSFIATTANRFTFPDGSTFSAKNPEAPPLLTVAVQPGLQYGTEPQPLVSDANLAVGQNLLLSGGTISSRGQLSAGGELTVEGISGNVDVQGLAARTATLTANGNLLLNGSQLSTTGNLTLEADGDVQLQDSVEQPLIADAGVDLIVQAGGAINTLDLSSLDGNNNPNSQLSAGRDLVLRAPTLQLANRPDPNNALYRMGSYLRTEQLDGTLVDLWIPYNDVQVVRANADVEFSQNYDGSSLYILAGGQVSVREGVSAIKIGVTGQGGSTATLSNGVTITLQSVDQGTLDIRAGVNSEFFSGIPLGSTNLLPANTVVPGIEQIGAPTGADITIGDLDDSEIAVGSTIENFGGSVALTNQFQPRLTKSRVNTTPAVGDITIQRIDTSSSNGADGGNITLEATGSINSTEIVDSGPFSLFSNTGSGGGISLIASSDINANLLDSGSNSNFGDAGNAGDITLFAGNSININDFLNSASNSLLGNAGNGGTITLVAGGNINSDETLNSSSTSGFGNAGSGGRVSFAAGEDIELNREISSFSFSSSNTENGGEIALDARGNLEINSDLSSFSFSSADSGNGGGITLIADNRIDVNSQLNSGSFSLSATGTVGNGGSLILAAGENLNINEVLNASSIASSGGTAGNGGMIILLAGNDLIIRNILGSFSFSEEGAAGNGGDITLSADKNIKVENILGSFSYSTLGTAKNAGDIVLSAKEGSIQGQQTQIVAISGAELEREAGRGGNVTFEVQEALEGFEVLTLSFTDQSGAAQIKGLGDIAISNTNFVTSAQVEIENFLLLPDSLPISTSDIPGSTIRINTENIGQSGNASVTSSGNLSFDNVEIRGNAVGSNPAGNVTIESPGQIIFSNSRIISDTESTKSTAQGGNIEIQAAQIRLRQESKISSETSGASPAGSIRITTPLFTIEDQATITTNTSGKGEAGNIVLQADAINLLSTAEEGSIVADTQGGSPAGTLTLRPNSSDDLTINLANQSRASVSTSSTGPGGNLLLAAPNTVTVSGSGTLSAETSAEGPGGQVQVQARDFVLKDGAQLSTSTTGSGNGGNLIVDVTDSVRLENKAQLVAQSSGQANGQASGRGGDIKLSTTQLNLEEEARITVSSSETGNGGNIDLDVRRAILLRNQSLIETDARGSGNGGNITIKTPFLIGFRGENSDIIANAVGGDGGRIEIQAQNLFNFEQKDGQNRSQLRGSRSNDISASSESGTDGTVFLDTPDVDPSRGLAELPTDLVDPSNRIAQGCNPSRGTQGRFVDRGRGGLPSQPSDPLGSSGVWEDVNLPQSWQDRIASQHSPQTDSTHRATETIWEAKRWSRNAKGEIELFAQEPHLTELRCQLSS